MTSVHVRNDIL